MTQKPTNLQHLADTAGALKLQAGLMEQARKDGVITAPPSMEGAFVALEQLAAELATGLTAAFNDASASEGDS